MVTYPIAFETKVTAGFGTREPWLTTSPDAQLACAVPKEFEGPGGALSPEDFYAQALTNCFLATFQVMAEKSKVTFEHIEVTGALTVDRDEQRRPVMKAFHFVIRVVGAAQPDRVTTLVRKALDSGFILNSVKTTMTHTLELA